MSFAAYLRQMTGAWRKARARLSAEGFDQAYYLQVNPDVGFRGFDPWQHYRSRGRREGRFPSREAALHAPTTHPREPDTAEWEALSPNKVGMPTVDVVMPVYSGRAETLRALHRVLSARNRLPFELVVVDDSSPDPVIAGTVRSLAQRGLLTLLSHERNAGFVVSCNRGIALHPDRDVVLLNADTEVFGDWLDRLQATVAHNDTVATATPWSNAATILSYPVTLGANSVPLEVGDAGLDALAATLGGAPPVEVPTGVGFCMYIRRRCLDAVGPFDERHFGRGYGEENDLCRRAHARGWRHMAAADVFVRHYDGRSFGDEKRERVEAAVAAVERLHPGYNRLIHDFIRRDPLGPLRRRLDELRVRRASPETVLVWGDAAVPVRPGLGCLRLRAEIPPFAGCYRIEPDLVAVAPNLPLLDPDRPEDARAAMDALGVVAMRIPADVPAALRGMLTAAGVPAI